MAEEGVVDERKEIQLVDPLYEPVIMYPIKKLPICDECLKVYQKYYKEFSNHYQKLVRTQWKEKIAHYKQRFKAENIDFDKHLERELRLKVQKSDNAYKNLKELIIGSRTMERDRECGYVEYESAEYKHPKSCQYKP